MYYRFNIIREILMLCLGTLILLDPFLSVFLIEEVLCVELERTAMEKM